MIFLIGADCGKNKNHQEIAALNTTSTSLDKASAKKDSFMCVQAPDSIAIRAIAGNVSRGSLEFNDKQRIHYNHCRVDSLNISGLVLLTIPKEIGNLTALTSLNISRNSVVGLPREIENLAELRYLDLSHQDIRDSTYPEIPVEIGKLSNLEILKCNSYNLMNVPLAIGNCIHLRELNLDRNRLENLPVELGKLSNLVSLDVSHNPLKTVPAEIGDLGGLATLQLTYTYLKDIPDEIGKLHNLKVLSLENSRGNLACLPPAIGELVSLESLNCAGNQLTSLPQEIGKLRRLTYLNLETNRLGILPREIGNCIDLKYLNIEGNRLTTLPAELENLANLTHLNLKNNRLTTLPEGITKLAKLDTIDLGNNLLEQCDLSDTIVKWLNKKCPHWRYLQKMEQCPFLETDSLSAAFDSSGNARSNQITILPIGKPRCDETNHVPPEGRYLALSVKDSLFELDTVALSTIQKTYDSDNGKQTIRVVQTIHKQGGLLLIDGIPGLCAGPVKTWHFNPRWVHGKQLGAFGMNDQHMSKKLLQKKISLGEIGSLSLSGRVLSGDDIPNGYAIHWKLRFNNDDWIMLPLVTMFGQMLAFTAAKDIVLWVGDLDGDKKADVLLAPNLGACRPLSRLQLFLSSRQKPGQIWRPASNFIDLCAGAGDWVGDDPACGQ